MLTGKIQMELADRHDEKVKEITRKCEKENYGSDATNYKVCTVQN